MKTEAVNTRRLSGLEWLRNKQKISPDQFVAGVKYGKLFRVAGVEGPEAIRSCLDIRPRSSGGGGILFTDLETIAWQTECRRALNQARFVGLASHGGLIATCDVICGKQWTPAEVTTERQEVRELETALRIALDLLITHFAPSRQTATERVDHAA